MKVNKRKLRRTWGDLKNIPFLEAIQERLPSIGFCNDVKIDYDSGFIKWCREIESIELVLALIPARSSKGEIEFSVQIGFDSKVLKEVLDSIKPWECNHQFVTFKSSRGNII